MRTRTTASTLSLIVVTALVGACGGGGDDDGIASLSGAGSDGEGSATSTTLSEEDMKEAMLDWAECMREHGIDVPDPQFGEDGEVMVQVGRAAGDEDDGGDSGPPSAEDRTAFETAREECGDPPAMGSFTEEDREEMEQDALEFAECMRDEGIADFPDPDFSNLGPGRGPETREETVADGDGSGAKVFGPWGEVDLEDPETAAAFEACQEELGGPGGPGGGERPAVSSGRASS